MDVPLRLYPRKFHLDQATVLRHVRRYLTCVELLPDSPLVEHWLDFGCGSGYGTRLLANFVEAVDGYDKDPEAQKYQRSQGSVPGVQFHTELPKAPVYDAIFMVEIVEHLKKETFARVLEGLVVCKLRDGGHIVLTTPIVEKTGPSKTNPHHICEYSVEDFESLVIQLGLKIQELRIEETPCTNGTMMEQGFFVLRCA